MAAVSISVTCCQAGRRSRGLITRAGTLRCSVNVLPVQDRSPHRFSRAYRWSRIGPRTFRTSRWPRAGLMGAADESLVGLPRGYVPLRDRRVLLQELRDGRVGLGGATLAGFLQQPAEFDVRLLLGLSRGLEADLAPGERIDAD